MLQKAFPNLVGPQGRDYHYTADMQKRQLTGWVRGVGKMVPPLCCVRGEVLAAAVFTKD